MIARDNAITAPPPAIAAAMIRSHKVVDLGEFRRATRYTAICPECRTTLVVHGMATGKPPICACGEQMVALRLT